MRDQLTQSNLQAPKLTSRHRIAIALQFLGIGIARAAAVQFKAGNCRAVALTLASEVNRVFKPGSSPFHWFVIIKTGARCMLSRKGSLDSPNTATAIVDTDFALKHRIETLAVLLTALTAEVDRLRAESSPTKNYLPNHSSEAEFRQASINDEGIDFYREIELYEIELIKRALQREHGCQRRAAELLGLNPTTLNAKIKHFGTIGFDLTLFVRNMADRQSD